MKAPLSDLFHVPSPHLLLQLLDYNYSKGVEFIDHHFLSSLATKFEKEGDTIFLLYNVSIYTFLIRLGNWFILNIKF